MAEKKVVLIVEDNMKILDLNRRLLEKDGCMVVTANTLAEARDLLEVIASPPRASSLSQKELAVARLAAEGFSNKDIAEKVYLSESRIKTCLSGIYRKLGITGNNNNKGKRLTLAEALRNE